MNRFNIWMEFALAALLGLLACGRVDAGQLAISNGGDVVINGFLACTHSPGQPVCVTGIHYIELVQGRTYDLRMTSTAFDAFLVLESMQGQQLAADIDDFDALHDRIVFTAPATGSYRLIATARPPINEGMYMITIREMPVMMRVEEELSPGDAMRGDGHVKVYDVQMTAGRRYIIDLQSRDFDAFVKLLNHDDAIVAFAEEPRADGMTRLVYMAPKTETLRIVCTTFAARATGNFTLNVCEE